MFYLFGIIIIGLIILFLAGLATRSRRALAYMIISGLSKVQKDLTQVSEDAIKKGQSEAEKQTGIISDKLQAKSREWIRNKIRFLRKSAKKIHNP